MGTRADFYIGKGADAEWLGSVAWDGSEWDEDRESPIAKAKTEDEFRAAVTAMLAERDDATLPAQGWPWPWNDSNTTDYAYMLIDGEVKAYGFGRECFINEAGEMDVSDEKVADFPDMTDRKNVTLGARSGVMVFGT